MSVRLTAPETRAQHWAELMFLTAFASLAAFQLRVVTLPQALKMSFIPDDGMYYLLPARNFVKLGSWTFDQGFSHTTGFHLGWAWIMVGLVRLRPGLEVLPAVFLGCLLTLALAFLTGWLARKDAVALATAALLTSSLNVAHQSVSMLEWPLALGASAAYAWALWHSDGTKGCGPLFVIGLVGSLSRSEFGMMPALMALVSLGLWLALGWRRKLSGSLAGLGGAIVGVLVVFAHNLHFGGSILQGSAEVKLIWGRSAPTNVIFAGRTFADLLFGMVLYPDPEGVSAVKQWAVLLGSISGLMFLALWAWWKPLREQGEAACLFFLGSCLSLVGYHILYSFEPGVQLWYSALEIVPLGITLWLGASRLRPIPRNLLILAMAWLTIANMDGLWRTQEGRYPWQLATVSAGKYIREHRAEIAGPVGSWNAGILSYYAGGDIVNIDGLMNNDVIPFIASKKLASYLAEKNIAFLVDNGTVFSDLRSLPGGYGDGVLEAAVKSKTPIGGDSVVLYELDLAKLRQDSR